MVTTTIFVSESLYFRAFLAFITSSFPCIIESFGFNVLFLNVSHSFMQEDQRTSYLNNLQAPCGLVYQMCSPFSLESFINKDLLERHCLCLLLTSIPQRSA